MEKEKRLIDANALFRKAIEEKRFVFQMEDLLHNEIVVQTVYRDLGEFILNAPTVDAVEVVRCKDCKHYKRICGASNRFMCMATHGLIAAKADDFCSYGERREGE